MDQPFETRRKLAQKQRQLELFAILITEIEKSQDLDLHALAKAMGMSLIELRVLFTGANDIAASCAIRCPDS